MTRLPARPLEDSLTSARLDPDRPLLWRRTVPMAWEFELKQDEAVLGEMEGEGMPSTGWGECLGRELELRLDRPVVGFPRIYSRPADPDAGQGPEFRGVSVDWGRVHTAGGERLRWRRSLPRIYDHVLVDPAGRAIVRLRPSFFRFGRTETRVVLGPAASGRADLPHLLLLTWFLRIQSEPRLGRLLGGRTRKSRRLPTDQGE